MPILSDPIFALRKAMQQFITGAGELSDVNDTVNVIQTLLNETTTVVRSCIETEEARLKTTIRQNQGILGLLTRFWAKSQLRYLTFFNNRLATLSQSQSSPLEKLSQLKDWLYRSKSFWGYFYLNIPVNEIDQAIDAGRTVAKRNLSEAKSKPFSIINISHPNNRMLPSSLIVFSDNSVDVLNHPLTLNTLLNGAHDYFQELSLQYKKLACYYPTDSWQHKNQQAASQACLDIARTLMNGTHGLACQTETLEEFLIKLNRRFASVLNRTDIPTTEKDFLRKNQAKLNQFFNTMLHSTAQHDFTDVIDGLTFKQPIILDRAKPILNKPSRMDNDSPSLPPPPPILPPPELPAGAKPASNEPMSWLFENARKRTAQPVSTLSVSQSIRTGTRGAVIIARAPKWR